ncbi:uncharacterized protein LOC131174695 [Hevea brasiliensis]|uniref:uncharacterized protein LOC131174695 n=1 Tax=Hevea brasiliensis TaxID=3981 RepID=UPI002601525F|nr:uncharacterized protein LOC131174695 [Hevea brasiliensis]
MRPGESIADMSTRFTDLVNLLKALGKRFEEAELVKKILRSLPKSWEAKTTVIQDTKDFKTFTYDELIGSLIAHEMVYKKGEVENEQKKKKSIALKSNKDEDKKKGVAFKVDSSDNSSISSDDEDEMAVLARKFKRAFKKGGSKYKKFLKKYTPKDKHFKDSKEEIVCYECHKPGHIKPKCPLLKKKKGKEDRSKKAMKVVWSNSEESSNDESSDKEAALLCLMACEEKVESSQKDEESDNEVCCKGMKESDKWYIDSGCSKHMVIVLEVFYVFTNAFIFPHLISYSQ